MESNKYRLLVKKTSSHWSHDGACYRAYNHVLDYELTNSIHKDIPNYKFIEEYSNEIGEINEYGCEILAENDEYFCCGYKTICTSAFLIKLMDGG